MRHPGTPWGLEGAELTPVRGAYLLRHAADQYLLKPTTLSRKELRFVAAVLSHLQAAGLYGAPELVPTPGGEPAGKAGRQRYQLFRWREGHEADYLVPGEVEQAGVALARLHLAGAGFTPPFPRFRVLHGTWPRRLRRKRTELAHFAGVARAATRPTPFAREYVRLTPAWLAAADRAIEELAASPYPALAAEAARRGCICHHDLAHHNLLLTDGGPALVDFDYALADLGLHDLANLLRRLIRLTEWDPGPALAVLAAYGSDARFGVAEAKVLLPLLRFPEEAWLTGRQYYVEHRSWTEERFLDQLLRKADTARARKACLAAIKGRYQQ